MSALLHGEKPLFKDTLKKWPREQLLQQVAQSTEANVLAAATRAESGTLLRDNDLAALLSPAAVPHLEQLAQIAHQITVRSFGRTVQLFTPLYLANFCTNQCVYCGFNASNTIRRSMLTMDEIEAEGKIIAETGLRHILLLTGDAPKKTGPAYMAEAVKRLAPYFPGISVEVYALTEDEYRFLVESGVDSMTLFQETYNEVLYPSLHPSGPKSDFTFRLEAPGRAAAAGMRGVNVGALLGLDQWAFDAFCTIQHARWLETTFPGVETAISTPRIRPHAGAVHAIEPVSDTDLTQIIIAARLFQPMSGITLSSRENARFRDALIRIAITKVSAGVSTAVGGHATKEEEGENEPQFHISDSRNVDQMADAIRSNGYQPMYKYWQGF